MLFHYDAPLGLVPIRSDRIDRWMNGRQLLLIDYLREENRVLRKQLGGKRLRFTSNQCHRLAVKAKGLGWKALVDLGTIVTPETRQQETRSRTTPKSGGD